MGEARGQEVVISNFFYSEQRSLERRDLGWGNIAPAHYTSSWGRCKFLSYARSYNMAFYHVGKGRLFCLHFDECPIALKEHPLDPKIDKLVWRIRYNSWLDGRYLAIFHNTEEVWDTLRIDGLSLEQLIEESYLWFWDKFQLQRNSQRDIAIPDFFGPNDHLYRDQLGVPYDIRRGARTANSYHVYTYLMNMCSNVMDFDPVTHIWWGIHAERWPAPVGRMPYDPSQPYEMWRWGQDTHDMLAADVVAHIDGDNYRDFWREPVLQGRTLEEVFRDGYMYATMY